MIEYLGHLINENCTDIVEGTILSISRLVVSIYTVITCMEEKDKRVDHRKKSYSDTYVDMLKLAAEQVKGVV